MKTCKCCGKVKEDSDFFNRKYTDRVTLLCKVCRNRRVVVKKEAVKHPLRKDCANIVIREGDYLFKTNELTEETSILLKKLGYGWLFEV